MRRAGAGIRGGGEPEVLRAAPRVQRQRARQRGRRVRPYLPKENAHFVRVAKGSLLEARSWLLKGKRRRYWPEADYDRAWRLSCRTLKAMVRYLQYLDSCDGELPESIAGPRPAKKRAARKPKSPEQNPEPEEPRI